MSFIGKMLFEDEPERECWHEAGHAIVGHHLGMKIMAIGFSWISGEEHAPNPSTWIETFDGFENDLVATQCAGGVAAEITKLRDYDFMACKSDEQLFQQLGCAFPLEHYVNEAIKILGEREAALVRVYDRLMQERNRPSYSPFVDSVDHMKKQVHLKCDDFESLIDPND
jgi:hypothetical protein